MANDWNNGLFGCFANFGTCLMTFLLPCITFGQLTEQVDTCGCVGGAISLYIPFWNLYLMAKTREAVREEHNIAGGFVGDLFTMWFCGCCAVIQAKNQMDGVDMGMSIERV